MSQSFSRVVRITAGFALTFIFAGCGGVELDLEPEILERHEELFATAGASAQADLAFAAVAPKTLFHVATNGNDSNPGTQAAPWRTLGRAVQGLSAGQAAYVHAGTYVEHVDISRRDGTAAAPIVLMGAPGEAKPIIQASRNTAVFRVTRAYWRVSGFEVNGNGVQGQGMRAEGGHHIVFSDNVVRDGSGGSAISVYNGANNVGILRNKISNYRWYVNGARKDSHGIHILPNASRVLIQDNESSGNSGDGMQCTGVSEAGFGTTDPSDITVEDNRFHHNGENAIDIKSCHRLTIRGGAKDNSKLYGHRAAEDTGTNCAGAAVVIHFKASQVLFENNRLWDNGIGVTVGRDDALARDIVIRHNLIFNNTTAGRGCGDGVRVARSKNVEVSNNTIDNMPRSGIRVGADVSGSSKAEAVSVWNNIVRNAVNVIDVAVASSPSFVSDRNLFFKTSGTPNIRHNGGSKTLETWRTASKQDRTSKVADPKFPTDPLTGDYVLTAGSAGLDIGLKLRNLNFCGAGQDLGFVESCP
ncbi:MAG: right-handed parallel beta-helix repeat-containing protein [Myxococcaceae bacterium]